MADTSFTNNVEASGQFPSVYGHLARCPHCNTARPSLLQVYSPKQPINSEFFPFKLYWAIYQCTSCGMPVSLYYNKTIRISNGHYRHEYLVFPSHWTPDDKIPDVPRNYLEQAQATLGSPDASVVMSAAAIDAMLKAKGLVDGSLYTRIDKAVSEGILTKDMSEWAHLVRLNSNNPRHADLEKPNMTNSEAKLSLDFAKALAEIFFVLPSRMPDAKKIE